MSQSPEQNEKQWQAAIIELATYCGYRCYHTHDSRKSAPGFVDLVMARPQRPLLMIEVKSARGIVTPTQHAWVEVLQQTTGLRAEIWRPNMWTHIEAIIKHGMP